MEQNNLDNTSGSDVLVSKEYNNVLDLSGYVQGEITRDIVEQELEAQNIDTENGSWEVILPKEGCAVFDEAFYNFTYLCNVHNLNKVTFIGENAFSKCDLYGTIWIDKCEDLGWYAFHNCKGITEVVLNPNGISLPPAFEGCDNLTKIHYLNRVTWVEEGSIPYQCIPEKLWLDGCNSIGGWAFRDCSQLKEIVLKPGVRITGEEAFSGCKNLTKVYNMNKIKEIGYLCFFGCTSLTGKIWLDGCEILGESAFEKCTGITEVVLNPNVTMEVCAFRDCTSLTKVHNLNKIRSIIDAVFMNTKLTGKIWIDSCSDFGLQSSSQFENCTGITEVVLKSNNPPDIPELCFSGCSSLTKVHNLNKVKRIGSEAFSKSGLTGKIWIDGCESFSDVDYDEIVSKAKGVFKHCENITEVVLNPDPDKTPDITEKCFNCCSRLTKVYNLNKVKSIGKEAFNSSSLTGKIWIDGCESLGNIAFNDCLNITEVVLNPNNPPDIPEMCFQYDEKLTKVYYLNKVKNIGNYAFDCSGLTGKISIDSCGSLGEGAFGNCTNITEFAINEILYNTIKDSLDTYGISGNVTIIEKNKDPNETKVVYVDGNISYLNIDDLDQIPDKNNIKEIYIGNTVKEIPDDCFDEINSLTTVNIPDSVVSIGSYAFSACYNLTTVNIPDSVVSIDIGAFYGCRKLTYEIDTIQNIKHIGGWIFNIMGDPIELDLTEYKGFCYDDNFGQGLDLKKLTTVILPDNGMAMDYCYLGQNVTSLPNSTMEQVRNWITYDVFGEPDSSDDTMSITCKDGVVNAIVTEWDEDMLFGRWKIV